VKRRPYSGMSRRDRQLDAQAMAAHAAEVAPLLDADTVKPLCLCGSGLEWITRQEQLGKPTVTTCAQCAGTAEEPPRAQIIDLFEALKASLKGTK
jgi:hypothetical protein